MLHVQKLLMFLLARVSLCPIGNICLHSLSSTKEARLFTLFRVNWNSTESTLMQFTEHIVKFSVQQPEGKEKRKPTKAEVAGGIYFCRATHCVAAHWYNQRSQYLLYTDDYLACDKISELRAKFPHRC